MKKRFYLLAMLLTVWNDLCGQNDFERYALEQEAAFKAYSDKEEAGLSPDKARTTHQASCSARDFRPLQAASYPNEAAGKRGNRTSANS